jgi:hypothetical protein
VPDLVAYSGDGSEANQRAAGGIRNRIGWLRRGARVWQWAILTLASCTLLSGWLLWPHGVRGTTTSPDGTFEITIPAGWSAQVVRSPQEQFGGCPCYDIEVRSEDASDPDLRMSIEWVTWGISCGGPPGAEPLPTGWVTLGGQRVPEHESSLPDSGRAVALGGCTGLGHRLMHPGTRGTDGQFGVGYQGRGRVCRAPSRL